MCFLHSPLQWSYLKQHCNFLRSVWEKKMVWKWYEIITLKTNLEIWKLHDLFPLKQTKWKLTILLQVLQLAFQVNREGRRCRVRSRGLTAPVTPLCRGRYRRPRRGDLHPALGNQVPGPLGSLTVWGALGSRTAHTGKVHVEDCHFSRHVRESGDVDKSRFGREGWGYVLQLADCCAHSGGKDRLPKTPTWGKR